MALEDAENLVASNKTYLGNTMRISENNTDLGGSMALAGELDDLFNNVLRSRLEP